jgi:hypothetical protein
MRRNKNEAGYVLKELLFVVIVFGGIGVVGFVGICFLKILYNLAFGNC